MFLMMNLAIQRKVVGNIKTFLIKLNHIHLAKENQRNRLTKVKQTSICQRIQIVVLNSVLTGSRKISALLVSLKMDR